MKNSVAGVVVVGLAMAAGVVPSLVVAKGTSASVIVPKTEIRFTDVPAMSGVQIAMLDGDPNKGPSHFMLKFDGGFTAPLHHHTADHSGTVVTGALILSIDGKDSRLPAGSFFAFTGKAPHATRCEAGASCILSIDARGKWDVVPEKAVASASK